MTDSPHYTDHLIAALRCLDDDQLRKIASEIMERLTPKPDKCKLTLEDKLEYVAKLKLEYAQQDEFEKRVNRNLEP